MYSGKCLFSTQKIIVWKFQRVHQGGGGYDFVWSLYLNTSSARVIAKLLKEEEEETNRKDKGGRQKDFNGDPLSPVRGQKKKNVDVYSSFFIFRKNLC